MIRKPVSIFCILCLSISGVLCLFTKASGDLDANEILAIGTSRIEGGNMARAKQAALSQALMKGMEDYLVIKLGSEGAVNNFQRLVHEIIPAAKEGIENFYILAEDQTEEEYRILVRLKINTKFMDEKLRRSGLVLLKGPAIRVLFLIMETKEDSIYYWWKDPEALAPMTPVELAFHNTFQGRGLSPINRNLNIPEYELSVEMRSSDLTDKAILTWGKLYAADIVVCGRSSVMDKKEVVLMLRVFDVNKGSLIIQSMHIEPIEKGSKDNIMMAEALERGVNHLAARLMPTIIKSIRNSRERIHLFEVTLTGIHDSRQFTVFRNFLQKDVTGIRSVKQTRIKKDSVSMQIEFEGDRDKFLETILNHENLPLHLNFSHTEEGKILLEVE